jgi:predicted DNA-binding transcriptional regulator AlpA
MAGQSLKERQQVAQVRGVLAQRVVVSTPLDPFLSLQALAAYSGLSRRKLRDYLTDPGHPLPCYRIGGKIVVRRSEYDAWAARYRRVGNADLDKVVAETLRGLRASESRQARQKDEAGALTRPAV